MRGGKARGRCGSLRGMHASQLPADWASALSEQSGELARALAFVEEERARGLVHPPREDVFTAFHLTPLARVRVVLLGQDPYHGAGQAHGLAFSVRPGVKLPPSLVNVFKELATDLGHAPPTREGLACGDLTGWAEQGVLLLNTLLTVRDGEPASHAKIGWETVTDGVLRAVSERREPAVFLLWGNLARKKAPLVAPHHAVIEGAHPSPLSAKRFFGSRPFSQVDAALARLGGAPIRWDALA